MIYVHLFMLLFFYLCTFLEFRDKNYGWTVANVIMDIFLTYSFIKDYL